MIEYGRAGELDAATDRAARAARALATIANDAAREYVKRDAVPAHPDRADVDMVERERQNRLRRWQTPPHLSVRGK